MQEADVMDWLNPSQDLESQPADQQYDNAFRNKQICIESDDDISNDEMSTLVTS